MGIAQDTGRLLHSTATVLWADCLKSWFFFTSISRRVIFWSFFLPYRVFVKRTMRSYTTIFLGFSKSKSPILLSSSTICISVMCFILVPKWSHLGCIFFKMWCWCATNGCALLRSSEVRSDTEFGDVEKKKIHNEIKANGNNHPIK